MLRFTLAILTVKMMIPSKQVITYQLTCTFPLKGFHSNVTLLDVTLVYLKLLGAATIYMIKIVAFKTDY